MSTTISLNWYDLPLHRRLQMNGPKSVAGMEIDCTLCNKHYHADLGLAYDDLPETYLVLTLSESEFVLVAFGLKVVNIGTMEFHCVGCEDNAKYRRGMTAIGRWKKSLANAVVVYG